MRRWFFYLFIGLSAFGCGSTIAERFSRQTERMLPNAQRLDGTRSFGNLREDLTRSRRKVSLENQSVVQKKKFFICHDKILSAVLKDSRKDREFDADFKNYLEVSNASDCRDILFIEQKVDLNGDKIKEFIVRGNSSLLCGGTGNCSMWIYRKSGNSYQKLLDTGGEYLTVKHHSTGGYKDIFVRSRDSASSSYQAIFKFHRGKYKESRCLFVDEFIPGDKNISTCAAETARIEKMR